MRKDLTYVFVHGLSGWGAYDEAYQRMPYWGMRGGDLIAFLRDKGFACYAASVSPTGSAWDRACELYAQLSGTRVDYGVEHCRKYRHERFGRDFSSCPLIPDWGPDTRLVLLGHSFGGATARLFAHLMAYGDAAERKAADDPEGLSSLFVGGMGDRIYSLVTLAAPTNGTTAYDLFMDPDFDPGKVRVPWWSKPLARMMSRGTRPRMDDRDERDYAGFDMQIDNALRLNRRMITQPSVYYFSVPCCLTVRRKDGTYRPGKKMEPLFVMRACQIGAYKGKTREGRRIGENWRRNDGLVNTVSAAYPIGAPARKLNQAHIEPGVWNVFPTYKGDHMALQGGLMHKHDIRGFYLDLLTMISTLE